MQQTAQEKGQLVKDAKRLAPSPVIEFDDIKNYIGEGWHIKGRRKRNYFIAEKNGYATLYVSGHLNNTQARQVYVRLFDAIPDGHDIEHLYPRSRAKPTQLVAVGHIPASINRSHGNRGEELQFAFKAMGLKADEFAPLPNPGMMLAGGPTAAQLGHVVEYGYLVPVSQLKRKSLVTTSLG